MGFKLRKKKKSINAYSFPLNSNKPAHLADWTIAHHLELSKYSIMPSKTMADISKEHFLDTLPYKVSKAYRWAVKNDYFFGLIKSSLSLDSEELYEQGVKAYLDVRDAKDYTVPYVGRGYISNNLLAWYILQEKYGYNAQTNTLEVLRDKFNADVYVEDIELVYCRDTITPTDEFTQEDIDSLVIPDGLAGSWGKTLTRDFDTTREHTEYRVDDILTHDIAVIYYCFTSKEDFTNEVGYMAKSLIVEPALNESDLEGTYVYTFSMEIDFLEYQTSGNTSTSEEPVSKDLLVAQYYDETNNYKVFMYALGTGVIPELDNLGRFKGGQGEYMPRVWLHYAYGRWWGADSAKEIKHLRDYSNKLGLDYDEVARQIKAQDLGKGTSAIVWFLEYSVNLVPEHGKDQPRSFTKYLYMFFDNLYKASGSNAGKQMRTEFSDKAYSYSFGFSKLEKIITQERIGYVGTVQQRTDGNKVWFSKQITEKSVQHYVVYDVYIIDAFEGRQAWATLSQRPDDVVVPIDRKIANLLSYKDREELYHYAFNVRLGTLTVTKQWAWSKLKVFMYIAQAVLAVYTFGAGNGFLAGIKAIMQMGIKTLAVKVLTQVAIGYVTSFAINHAVKLLVKLGLDANLVGVLIGAVAFLARNPKIFKEGLSLNADILMGSVNLALGTAQKAHTLVTQNTLKEARAFQEFSDAKWAELKKAQELLGNDFDSTSYGLYSPNRMTLSPSYIEPNDFYSLRLSTEPHQMGYDYITNFVDVKLALPKDTNNKERDDDWNIL